MGRQIRRQVHEQIPRSDSGSGGSEIGAEGVIVAVGGNIGGRSLHAKAGKPVSHYNFHGVHHDTITGTAEIPPGTHQVRMEFKYDGGGLAKGGDVTLYIDAKEAGKGRIERTEPMVFSADETLGSGDQYGSPVTPNYPKQKKFNGDVAWVAIDIDKDAIDLDHLISPEERLKVAMALQ